MCVWVRQIYTTAHRCDFIMCSHYPTHTHPTHHTVCQHATLPTPSRSTACPQPPPPPPPSLLEQVSPSRTTWSRSTVPLSRRTLRSRTTRPPTNYRPSQPSPSTAKFTTEVFNVHFGFAPGGFVYEKFSGAKYRVTLQGMIKRVSGGAATAFSSSHALFTMPDGSGVLPNLRPQNGTLVFRCAAQYSLAAAGAAQLNRTTRVDISTNGIVTANTGGAGDDADMVNLDGITYWVIP